MRIRPLNQIRGRHAHHESFWKELPRPFFAMAPMADVTDVAFRALVAKRGKPDVMFTEFVSADGLHHTREIQKMPDAENPLLRDLRFTEEQRPIVAPHGHFHFSKPEYRQEKVAPHGHFHFSKPEYRQEKLVAQIFSSKPEMVAYAAKLVAELGFDGVDINMGCPDRAIERQGAGAALMKDPELAIELIRAAQGASALPVSVKTRVGYREESLEEWFGALLSANPAAITLHLRTRKELSLVPADWNLMKRAVEIRDEINPSVLLIGNGDARDLADARAKAAESGCDGVMLGRAVFGNPWLFAGRAPEDTPLVEKLAALVELAHNFEKISPPKNFSILKKHIKAFVSGFDGAADLRARLMSAASAADLERILRENPL